MYTAQIGGFKGISNKGVIVLVNILKTGMVSGEAGKSPASEGTF